MSYVMVVMYICSYIFFASSEGGEAAENSDEDIAVTQSTVKFTCPLTQVRPTSIQTISWNHSGKFSNAWNLPVSNTCISVGFSFTLKKKKKFSHGKPIHAYKTKIFRIYYWLCLCLQGAENLKLQTMKSFECICQAVRRTSCFAGGDGESHEEQSV